MIKLDVLVPIMRIVIPTAILFFLLCIEVELYLQTENLRSKWLRKSILFIPLIPILLYFLILSWGWGTIAVIWYAPIFFIFFTPILPFPAPFCIGLLFIYLGLRKRGENPENRILGYQVYRWYFILGLIFSILFPWLIGKIGKNFIPPIFFWTNILM